MQWEGIKKDRESLKGNGEAVNGDRETSKSDGKALKSEKVLKVM